MVSKFAGTKKRIQVQDPLLGGMASFHTTLVTLAKGTVVRTGQDEIRRGLRGDGAEGGWRSKGKGSEAGLTVVLVLGRLS